MHHLIQRLALSLLFSLTLAAAPRAASDPTGSHNPGIQPLLVQPDKVLLAEDFEKPHALDPKIFEPRQSTLWKIGDGVLKGAPAPAEFQKGKQDHDGAIPRMMILAVPNDYAIEFSYRLHGGSMDTHGSYFELGHHVARIGCSAKGLRAIVDDDTKITAVVADFKIEDQKWYHVLVEVKGDEFVVQYEDGTSVYAKDPIVAKPRTGFTIACLKQGTVDVDNLTVWSAKSQPQPGWEAARAKFPPPPTDQPAAKRPKKAK